MLSDRIVESWHQLPELALKISVKYVSVIALLGGTLLAVFFLVFKHETSRDGVPILGYVSKYEYTMVLQNRFTLGALDIIKRADTMV